MEEQQNQISVEYASQQIKKARKKGLVQGLLIALGCFFITVIIISAVSTIQMIVNGSFYARMMGSTSSPVLDKKSIDKIDSLYGLIENTYLVGTREPSSRLMLLSLLVGN